MAISAKSVVAIALIPLCFLPAAFLQYATQVRLAAFEGVGARTERVASQVASRVPRAPIELASTGNPSAADAAAPAATTRQMAAGSPDGRIARNSTAGWVVRPAPTPARGCKDWRPLNAGPAALAASVGPVRVCEGAPPQGVRRVAAQSSPTARPRAAKHPTMSFTFDLTGPR